MPKAKKTATVRRNKRSAKNSKVEQVSLASQAANQSEIQDNWEPISETYSVSAQCCQGCLDAKRLIESNTNAINKLSEKMDEMIKLIGNSANIPKEIVPVETNNIQGKSQAAILREPEATSSAITHEFLTTFPIGGKSDLLEFDQKLKEKEFFTRVVNKVSNYSVIVTKVHVFFYRFLSWLESVAIVRASC